ncbi:spore germination cell wall hydrolase CwlJ-like protein [Sphingobium boeckii]|uniref:Spore germination cell wall hydrolase CwlJ-like protein n=2 Tax=Sphingobium boeckii TaxID=1082345 RepID=A0A7W9EDK8_9SPHN|nr:spore germination cell wall hydrolase CwlJ-like protein [Sphingobium boeckii]
MSAETLKVDSAPAPAQVPAIAVEPVSNAVEAEPVLSSLRALVAAEDIEAPLSAEEECLAGAVYFESRNESLEGQHAVADVVINRAESGRFPSSICGVVYQPSQFSFVRGGRMPAINRTSIDWREAVAVARVAMDDDWQSAAPKALFFHATRVSPGWRLKRVATVGNHVFYR